jgi:hypothetical protein
LFTDERSRIDRFALIAKLREFPILSLIPEITQNC